MKLIVKLTAAISADGKITTAARDLHLFGGAEDQDRMDALRAWSDAVLIGAGTLREENPQLCVASAARIAARMAQGKQPHPVPVIVSRHLDFEPPRLRVFTAPAAPPVIFTSAAAPAQKVAAAAEYATIKVLPATADGQVDLPQLCTELAALGIERLLLEGGGELNFLMLKAGLIDDLHITVAPLIIGGRAAPGPFGGDGFPASELVRLTLLACERGNHGELFLHYRTTR